MFVQLGGVLGKIIFMMAVGFVLAKAGIMSGEMKRNLSTFLMKAVLPFNIISSAGQEFSNKNGIGMLEVLGICCVYYAGAIVIMGLLTKKWRAPFEKGVVIDLAVFANVGFVGFPLMGEFMGETGTLYTMAYNIGYQLFFFSYGMLILKDNSKMTFGNMFRNSIIYVSIVSILLYFSTWRFPAFLQSSISSIGNMMIPVSMIIIGWEIANTNIMSLYKNKVCYMVSILRLIVFPLIMAVIMRCLHMSYEVSATAIILTALPSGSLTVIAAQEEGKDSVLAAQAVAQSTILMIVTLPFILLLINSWFR